MTSELLSQVTPRHIPPSLAPVVADFEMLGRQVVSVEDVARALGTQPSARRVEDAVRALVRLRWLRQLPARGVYEFLSARGGPYSAGDPLVEARAVLARRPEYRLAVVGSGAAFLRGVSERAPAEYAVAVDKRQGGSVTLDAAYRLVKTTQDRIADIPLLGDIPVSDGPHLLADAALWPATVGDLRDANHWLRRSLKSTDPAAAAAVGRRLGTAAAARMAYIAKKFGAPAVAAAVAATLPGRAKTFIGDVNTPIVDRDPRLGVDDRLGVASRG